MPVYKSSDKDQLQNYRPISLLLPAFSKIFEKVMYIKVISFMETKDMFYKHQYSFRSKHSTVHPIIHLLIECAEANNHTPKECTLSIFGDLSKAFDAISHDILIKKLNYYNIHEIKNTWFVSYLSDRFQYVDIDGHKSSFCPIIWGVPQGSIFGPLLYLIYVNDISMLTDAKILSFADDTSIILTHSNPVTLYTNANQ